MTVLVIGAGMAGLMAARTLHEAGVPVTILEGRDRIGGRTYTDQSLGAPIDLGAAWIHGPDGNPLTPLARQLGIAHAPTDFINRSGLAVQAYDAQGQPLD
ncbi:MAG: FAD-dependent oxidoreductase, partial [Anaerolineales bacterium]|nr:FAD-dependent oxidoreductase [Anaerolineales bacterium]